VRRFVTFITIAAVITALGASPALATAGRGGGSDEDPTLEETDDRPAKRTEDYHDTLDLAIDDIQDYWADTFPEVYGDEYDRIPDDRIIAAQPGVDIPDCQGTELTYADAEGNAFYCYKTNFVAYDDVGLFPQLFRDYGDFSIALVLAHEWGHAIQDRAENEDQPTILKELQADCFAGSWVGSLSERRGKKLSLASGELDSGIAALLQFRDPVGTSAEEEGAHGSGFDRVSAFQQGFDESAEACAAYFETPPEITALAFGTDEEAATGGNLPADEVLPATVETLNDFYTQNFPGYVELPIDSVLQYDPQDDEVDCDGETLAEEDIDDRVFYCSEDEYVAFDADYIQHIYDDVGDFGVFTLFGVSYATHAQVQQGFPGVDTNEENAVAAQYCYTGGFARALADQQLTSATLGGAVVISPGDLDETVFALIDYTNARGSAGLDLTFALVRTFREGFFNGAAFCESTYSEAGAEAGDGSA